jgi:hypothetical protein
LSSPAPEPAEESGAAVHSAEPADSSGLIDPGEPGDPAEEIRPWWRRSPPLAAGAALAIGVATLWFANMLGRVPLDSNSTFGYLLMLPLLLIVPAFSAAGLRLSWLALQGGGPMKWVIGTVVLAATAANGFAIAGFGTALWRIFSH